MAEARMTVQIDLRKIYAAACPKCKKKIRALIKDQITDSMVSRVIGEKKP